MRWFPFKARFGALALVAAALARAELSAQSTAPAPATAQASATVTVTAYRTPLGTLESPATTLLLTEEALNTAAAVTLDDKLRQLPGVELFRRSSSLVANPTSQGMRS